MAFVQNFPFFSIIISMFSGVLCAVLSPKMAKRLCLCAITLITVMQGFVLSFVIKTGEYYIYWMGHWPAPFGNEIRIGILEALLAFAFGIVMILSLLGGLKHIFHDITPTKVNYYFVMISLLFSSLLALIYTNDLFTAYVFVEINTITSCAIVMIKKGKETVVATFRYMVMSTIASGLFLLGICTLYGITGQLLMTPIKESVAFLYSTGRYSIPLETVIVLFSVGLAIKSALYPFHGWLPDAHGTSTSASSAILSGLVLKGYIILLIKIFYRVIGIDIISNSKAINVLFILGIVAMIMGSVNAVRQRDIKRMIAYSSVAQIGYIFMGLGLGRVYGYTASCYHIFAHAITKTMLFNCAGGFMDVSGGSRKFVDLKGAGRRNLLAGIAFTVGAMSMIGIPMTAGFMSKYYFAMYSFSMPGKAYIALAALAVSTMLNALYYVPAIMVLFRKTDDKITFVPDKKDVGFIVAMIASIGLNIFLGINGGLFMDLMEKGLRMLG